jgi:hypothetical protein
MSSTCDLCGELEDERALHIYRNGWLCRSCEGYWTDEELNQKGFINDDERGANEKSDC